MKTWNLTDTEFFVLWDDRNPGSSVPAPFFFTTDIESGAEFEARKLELRQSLRDRADAALAEVFAATADPDLRVVISGDDGSDSLEPGCLTRLLAVRRGGVGFVVRQLPGRTYWHGGGYTIRACDPLLLADAVVGELPEAGVGRSSEIVLYGSGDIDDSVGRSAIRDSFIESAGERAQWFLGCRPLRRGTIEVVQGRSRFGPRGVTRHRIEWRDLEHDGRYLIDDRDPPVARPVDSAALIAAVNTRIAAVVRAIKDERAGVS